MEGDAIRIEESVTLDVGKCRLIESKALILHDELCEPLSHLLGPHQSEIVLALVHEQLELLLRQVLGASSLPRRRLKKQGLINVQSEFLNDQMISRIQLVQLLKLSFIFLFGELFLVFEHGFTHNNTGDDGNIFECLEQLGGPIVNALGLRTLHEPKEEVCFDDFRAATIQNIVDLHFSEIVKCS